MNHIILPFLAANPFTTINSILTEIKGWLLGLVLGITVLVVVYHGLKYQQGNSEEKAKATKDIKSTVAMGGGIFILVWLSTYIIGKFQ